MKQPHGKNRILVLPAVIPAHSKPLTAFLVMFAPVLPIARAIIHHLLALPEPDISFKMMMKLPSAPKLATSALMPAPPIGHPAPVILPALPELKSPHRYHAIKTLLAQPVINPRPVPHPQALIPRPEPIKPQPQPH